MEEAYSYDPVGNRLTGPQKDTYTYDATNRLTSDGKATYTYDANGNLVEKRSLDDGKVTTYAYDAEDRLIRVVTSKAEVTFSYDPLGRRTEKRVVRWHDKDGDHEPDDDEAESARVTRYLYDQEDILATFSDTGREIARYTNGPGIDEPLAERRGNDTRFYHADSLGTIVALSQKLGHPVRQYSYSAFGVPEDHKGDLQPYRFTGREWDKEVGIYYYRARYYLPQLGRFGSEDPIRLDGGSSLYTYVISNPTRFRDPLGLYSWNEFMRDWTQWADIRTAQEFWREYRDEALDRGDWVDATVADAINGLLNVSGLPTVQESSEAIGSIESTLRSKLWAGTKIVAVGASWCAVGTTQVTGRIAGQARTSRLIGLRNRFGEHFYTDQHGFFFAIDRAFHRLHIGPWKTWFRK